MYIYKDLIFEIGVSRQGIIRTYLEEIIFVSLL